MVPLYEQINLKVSWSLLQANVKSSLSLSKHIVSEVTNFTVKPSEDSAT